MAADGGGQLQPNEACKRRTSRYLRAHVRVCARLSVQTVTSDQEADARRADSIANNCQYSNYAAVKPLHQKRTATQMCKMRRRRRGSTTNCDAAERRSTVACTRASAFAFSRAASHRNAANLLVLCCARGFWRAARSHRARITLLTHERRRR